MQEAIALEENLIVTPERTAEAMGSGDLPVLATPALVAALENVARRAAAAQLKPGQTTVGTEICLRHVAATPQGAAFTVSCRLTAQEGRRLTFALSASDCGGLIAEGAHERFIVDADRFLAKASAKK